MLSTNATWNFMIALQAITTNNNSIDVLQPVVL